jgi:hypothetical protein
MPTLNVCGTSGLQKVNETKKMRVFHYFADCSYALFSPLFAPVDLLFG